MARRIEIELTSARDDGTWTWRAAGAREPRGVVDATMLPTSRSVGDVLRVEIEIGLEGTEISSVLPPKEARAEPNKLELIGRTPSDDELVTTKYAGRQGGRDRDGDGRRGGRSRDDRGRGERGARDGGDRKRSGGDGKGSGADRGRRRPDGERPQGRDGDKRDDRRRTGSERPRRPPIDERPRPKRLRPQRIHRRAVLDTLEVHERPIAEEVLKGGLPAVRQAVEKQNVQARAEGRPEIDPVQLEALAERLLPRLRAAEWRDRADAALADIDELDLRDLRTVVVAADTAAKDEEARELAAQLKAGLERRIEADQAAWLAELAQLLGDGRVVRALRVSSRPPKAGSPLPPDLATRLIEASNAAMTEDTLPDRWATVLDALSLSPVHARVVPASVPAQPSDELKAAVAALGERVPLVAKAFGIEPVAGGPRRPRRRPSGPPGAAAKGPQRSRPVPPPPPPAVVSKPEPVAAEDGDGPPIAESGTATSAMPADASTAESASEPALDVEAQ